MLRDADNTAEGQFNDFRGSSSEYVRRHDNKVLNAVQLTPQLKRSYWGKKIAIVYEQVMSGVQVGYSDPHVDSNGGSDADR
jgi:hypothetical protein